MLSDSYGPPQLAALLILLQRGLEENEQLRWAETVAEHAFVGGANLESPVLGDSSQADAGDGAVVAVIVSLSTLPTKGMLSDNFGAPQLAALLILLQRGLEELLSQRNTRRLLQQGGPEAGETIIPLWRQRILAWIASLAFLVPRAHLCTCCRYRVPGPATGALLDHRHARPLLDPPHHHPPQAPIVGRGPYRFVSHPNYS